MHSTFNDKNIALDLVRVTEAGALQAAPFVGRGDKEAADGAAVDAMRSAFNAINVQGTVVIGEGEKDHAPMLYIGEKVGSGKGVKVDIAVDPVEGTTAVASGRANGLSVIGMAEANSMFNPAHSYYCKKIAVGAEAAGVIDIDAPIDYNLKMLAAAVGKDIRDLNIFVLDKPRHIELVKQIRHCGARVMLHSDGDVAGALMAMDPRASIDMLVGTGGTPEAVITACAFKGSGAQLLTRLDPQSQEEKDMILADGINLNQIRDVDDLVKSDECFFAATGITDGELLKGVEFKGDYAVTHSITTRGKTGTMRYIEAWHNRKKLNELLHINHI